MGLVESKKNGVVKKYELKLKLDAPIKNLLLPLTNWCFADIKELYSSFTRKSECPFIDFFIFHKIMPTQKEVSRMIFDSFSEGDKYINIFELICVLVLTSHNSFRKKLQILFIIFDFSHSEHIQNRQLLLIFQSFINGFCRLTGQPRPKYEYLSKYTIERFIRVNTLQALQKIVNYRRLIEEVEGNNDAFELFQRFQQDMYGYFKQESYLFMVSQYKKYSRLEIEKIYRIIKKVNLDGNYEEVEMIDKNMRFRLENRRIQCIKKLIEEKEEKFKFAPTISTSFSANKSKSISLSTLPTLQRPQHQSAQKSSLKLNTVRTPVLNNPQLTKKKSLVNNANILFLHGKTLGRQEIFQTITYFKTLSNNQKQIKIKDFFKTFQKKVFMKKQLSSLFRYFDKNRRGEVNFQEFLLSFYPGISKKEIDKIKQWHNDYKQIHEADAFDYDSNAKRKEKKNTVQLPRQTLNRLNEIFNSIDQGKKGYLSFQDMKAAYKTGFTIKQVQNIMKEFGKNNKIYKPEFIKMILPEQWTIEGTEYAGV